VAKAFLDSHGVGYETAGSGMKLESAEIGAAAKQFTFLLECYSEKLGAEHRALETERRALEAERRALDDERGALAEARERALRLEKEERARQAQVAAEQQGLHREKEMAEARVAGERVIQFHQEERVESSILAVRINGSDGAPMILVPEGEFLYGEDNQKLSLPGFYLDTFEVTTKAYAGFMEATGHDKPEHWVDVSLDRHGMLPVVGVEYTNAEAYCHYYNKRLPTEQEWEKAARGTDGRIYPWGNTEPTIAMANFGPSACGPFCNVYAEKLKPVNGYESGKSSMEFLTWQGMRGNG